MVRDRGKGSCAGGGSGMIPVVTVAIVVMAVGTFDDVVPISLSLPLSLFHSYAALLTVCTSTDEPQEAIHPTQVNHACMAVAGNGSF